MNSRHISEHTRMIGHNRSKRRVDYLFLFLLFLALLAILAVLVIASAVFLSELINIPLDSFLPKQYLPQDSQLYLSAGSLLLISFLLAILARWRIRRNRSYQFVSGCPACRQHDMIRVHRQRTHRFMATVFRLQIRKYACRSCQWQGVLLYYPPVGEITEAEAKTEPVISAVVQSIQPGAEDQDLSAVESALPISNNDQGSLEHESLQDGSEARAPDQLSSLIAESDLDPISEPDSEVDESPQDIDPISDVHDKASFPLQPVDAVAASAVTSAEDNNLTQVDPPRDIVSKCDQEIIGRAIVVTPFDLSLRTAPSNTAETILSLKPDTIVEIFELADENSPVNWRQICYEGRVGWVSAAFLRHLQD